MVRGLSTDEKHVKKRYNNPFWYQKQYKKSVTILGSSIGKIIGKAIRPVLKSKEHKIK